MTGRQRHLEAPHRRRDPGSRLFEKAVVRAYRSASWCMARVPARPARALIGAGAQFSYLVWPTKRRWSNANFGHVLGLPPDHPRVRRLALAAYREYGRYLVDVMRLSARPLGSTARLIPAGDLDAIEPIRARARGGLIFALGHIGNNEAVATAIASRGWPINVVADDSAYPELFDDFRRLRESWGVHLIPWRNLREIYAVLRRREMLGLLVDWGYRPDGIPVKLFDAWTTLPAGPAMLAAKTGSLIIPVAIRRGTDDAMYVDWSDPIEVPSADPAELVRATQRIADAFAANVAAAPSQWYSFKPLWPATPEESLTLERRAAAALAGTGPASIPLSDALSTEPGAAETGSVGSGQATTAEPGTP